MMRRALSLAVLAIAATLVACDEEDDLTGPGFICDVTNPVRDILLSPSSGQVFVHVPALASDTIAFSAIALNRFGSPRADVKIRFSSSDTTVATVDSLGVVSARRPGSATITASACGESSSAQVSVLASVTSVTLTPSSDTVVAGDSVTFRARAFGPGGVQVRNVRFTFSSPSSAVTIRQTSDSTAVVVTSLTPGTVAINATGEGVTGTASLLVQARIFIAGSVTANGIDVGDATACGIISAGQAFCWGLNSIGQLGAATDSLCFPGVAPTQIEDDSVVTTAKPCSLNPVRVARNLEFATISAGDTTTCGLTVDGRAWCWGEGLRGTIGNGTTSAADEPQLVTTALTFTSITVGGGHACGLATGGFAYCWGADSLGQLGDARRINSTTPIPVSGGASTAVFARISAGFRHTCAINAAGTAFCWGSNGFGQLGDGTFSEASDTPVQVSGGLVFASISAGGDHTCGVTTAGQGFCWGSNLHGQLGTGAVGGGSAIPVAVSGGLTFTRLSASTGTTVLTATSPPERFKPSGGGHTCGLTTTGAVFCWGDNFDLQLGRGPFSGGPAGASGTPVQVAGGELPGGVTFVSVSAGSVHSCGVGTDGAAYCWGSNIFGALGSSFQAHFRGLPQRVTTPR